VEFNAGENRFEILKPAPVLDQAMAKSRIFDVPILIATGMCFIIYCIRIINGFIYYHNVYHSAQKTYYLMSCIADLVFITRCLYIILCCVDGLMINLGKSSLDEAKPITHIANEVEALYTFWLRDTLHYALH